jgi:parallel beta-helix repeat protein
MPTKSSNFIHRRAKLSKRQALAVAVCVTLIGIFAILRVFGAGAPIAFEAEAGMLSGCARTVADAGASSGSSVKFISCGTGNSSDPTALDASGATIPDTNYPIPAGAIFMATSGSDSNPGTQGSPVKTLNQAITLAPSSGTIVVRAGLYRDSYNNGTSYAITTKTLTFQAYPHEQAWFDGTQIEAANNWTSDGAGHWSLPWSTPQFCDGNYYTYKYDAQPTNNTGPCSHFDVYADPGNPAAGDPQLVYSDGVYLHEANTLSGATAGNFFYDWANRRISISSDPSSHQIELAIRPVGLVIGGSAPGSKILGLGFKRYASNEYSNVTQGGVYIGGSGATIENDVFKQMAGAGLNVNPQNATVNSSVFSGNGYSGINNNGHYRAGTSDNFIVENSVFNGNNIEHYGTNCTASCGPAGMKMSHMVGFTVKNNIFENGIGNSIGVWCDLACTNGVFVDNLIKNNGATGLMYEVSNTGIIASNLIINNGSQGIRVDSANTKIFNNTVAGNLQGIYVYDDSRSYGVGGWTDVGPDTTNVDMANNIISGSNYSLVSQPPSTNASPNTGADQFFHTLDYNSYYQTNGSSLGLIYWRLLGSSTPILYKSLTSFTSGKGWEAHGFATTSTTSPEPFFVDQPGGNYIVRSSSTAYHASTTIPDDVAAALGLSLKTGYSRGAITWPGQ